MEMPKGGKEAASAKAKRLKVAVAAVQKLEQDLKGAPMLESSGACYVKSCVTCTKEACTL